jgi:lysophospholipase L1-like esterase
VRARRLAAAAAARRDGRPTAVGAPGGAGGGGDAAQRAPASGVHLQRRDNRQQLVDRRSGTILVDVPDPGGMFPAREILDAFEADPTLHQPWFLDHAHVNEEGHAIFAELALKWLREQGLLPQR